VDIPRAYSMGAAVFSCHATRAALIRPVARQPKRPSSLGNGGMRWGVRADTRAARGGPLPMLWKDIPLCLQGRY